MDYSNKKVNTISNTNPLSLMSELPVINSAATASKALEMLNTKLNEVSFQASFWGVYNIKYIINSAAEYNSILSWLRPNESAVINTSAIPEHNVGDICLKTSDGSIQFIAAQNGGTYYPSQIVQLKDQNNEGLNGYELHYAFTQAVPANSVEVAVGDILSEPAEEISFTGITDTLTQQVYNSTLSAVGVSTVEFNKISGITPVIRAYDIEGEEVHNYNVSSTTTKYTISNFAPIVVEFRIK